MVAGKTPLLNAVGVVVVSVGRQCRKTIELIQRPVEVVGPRLGGYVDHSAAGTAIFRGKVASQDAELLHRVEWHYLSYRGRKQINVLSSVQQNVGIR